MRSSCGAGDGEGIVGEGLGGAGEGEDVTCGRPRQAVNILF